MRIGTGERTIWGGGGVVVVNANGQKSYVNSINLPNATTKKKGRMNTCIFRKYIKRDSLKLFNSFLGKRSFFYFQKTRKL